MNIKTKIVRRLLAKDGTRKDVLNIALPVFIELMLGTLFGMVDMMMLGRISDPDIAAASVSAVGITNQPLFIGLSLVQSLNIGGTAIISRYVGSKQTDRIENTFRHILLLNLILFSIPLSIISYIFADNIMLFMGAEPDTIIVGRYYFKIIMIGFVFQSITSAFTAALRGTGNTKLPMKINLQANFINVIGNAMLIYGLFFFPKLGIVGAAISTAFSNLIAATLMIRVAVKGKTLIKLNLKNKFRFDRTVLLNLIKIGIPASFEQLVLRIGLLLFARIVASLGTVTYAAHQICLSILGLSFNPGQSFGISASTLVGRSLGSNEPDKAQAYAKETRKIGSLISTIMAVIFFFFGPSIVALYTSNQEIIKDASIALKIIAVVQPFQSSQLILAGGLRGAGDTVWPLISTLIGVLAIRVALAYTFVNGLGLGLAGAWLAVFVDQFIRWIIVFLRFNTGKWKYVKVQ